MKTLKRCAWCTNDPLYIEYHDKEWGIPVRDNRTLFEFLILEGAQAGLNWLTILKKRQGYQKAFANFDFTKVAGFTLEKIEDLLQNPDIIRNRLKVTAAVKNAKLVCEMAASGLSLNQYFWQFVDGEPIKNRWQDLSAVPTTTALSDQISKDLIQRGFKFVGSTIIYAFMQAVGMVNDHTQDCFCFHDDMTVI